MSWRFWQSDDARPVQWKTREPVRPTLHEDGGIGFILPKLGRSATPAQHSVAIGALVYGAWLAVVLLVGLGLGVSFFP